jgi:hypothetical protein
MAGVNSTMICCKNFGKYHNVIPTTTITKKIKNINSIMLLHAFIFHGHVFVLLYDTFKEGYSFFLIPFLKWEYKMLPALLIKVML